MATPINIRHTRTLNRDNYAAYQFHIESTSHDFCSHPGCIAEPVKDSIWCKLHFKAHAPERTMTAQQWNRQGMKRGRHGKPVREVGLDGQVLRGWASMRDCADELRIDRECLRDAIRRGRPCKGRMFRVQDSERSNCE
jgi:hypothetical protein